MTGPVSIARTWGGRPRCGGQAEPGYNCALQSQCHDHRQQMPVATVPPMPDDFASMHELFNAAEHASCEDVPYEELLPSAEERSSTLESWHTQDIIHRLCQTHRHM